jgi:hypothetical protein
MHKIKVFFIILFLFISFDILAATGNDWEKYEVYQPEIERSYIVKADCQRLPYNHCTNIAWFGDRWFCLWNGNNTPAEGKSGQLIYFSTSFDGKNWSEPRSLLSNSTFSDFGNASRIMQWQPIVGVVNGQLWCLFSQSGGGSQHRGFYFSKLEKPEGKWQVRKLTWNDSFAPVVNGKKFRIFPSQNLYQLRSGRVLAPVTIKGDRAPDAPDNVTNWWAFEKYNTVLYTDDDGETWHISPGTSIPDKTWANWEPTVWEVENGDVLMVARHNVHKAQGHNQVKPSKYLLSSVSHDGGETWEPHKYVPLETICSRPCVSPLDGRGTWSNIKPDSNFNSRVYFMVHSDIAGGYNWRGDRKNIALYLNRSSDFTFTPGVNITGLQPRVCYPSVWVHNRKMLVSYTRNFGNLRSLSVANISNLPESDKHYLLPRNNTMEPVYPELKSNMFHFEGMQYLESKKEVDPGDKGFSLGLWVKQDAPGPLIDYRTAVYDGGFSVSSHLSEKKKEILKVDVVKDLFYESKCSYGQWRYVGLTYDCDKQKGVFYINDFAKTVKTPWNKGRTLKGSTMYLGFDRVKDLEGFVGDIRAMAMYAGHVMDADAHRWLYNKYAESLGQKALSKKGNRPDAEPILWLDGADKKSLRKYFKPEPENTDGVKVVKHSGKKCLKINGEGSAGVDIDENYRSKGDIVEMKLRYKPLTDNAVVLCTAGDADHPGRVLLRDGKSILTAGSQELGCGEVSINGWNDIYLKTAENYTWVQVNDNAPAIVYHRPQGTWLFLGEGYPRDILSPNSSLLIDIDSVATRVIKK